MSEKSHKQAPQWFMLRNEVLSSIGRMNSPRADRLTYNVMIKATEVLMARQALPDGLKKTFIENIKRRTKHATFEHDGPIQLSANQWNYARKTGQDVVPDLSHFLALQSASVPVADPQVEVQVEVDVDQAELFEALQIWFIYQSTSDQPDFNLLSSFLGLKPAQTLEFWWRNVMKSNEINHEPDMTSAPQPMRLAGSPDAHDQPRAHEPAAPEHRHVRIPMKEHNHGNVAEPVPVPLPATSTTESREVVISYFHRDPARAPSAVLEFCGTRYALVFSTADAVEDKIYKASDSEWWGRMDNSILHNTRVRSRHAEEQGMVQRFVLSPIYATHDTFGRGAASAGNAMAILRWTDLGEPEAVELIDGDRPITVPLRPYAGRNEKAPSYKGRVVLPE